MRPRRLLFARTLTVLTSKGAAQTRCGRKRRRAQYTVSICIVSLVLFGKALPARDRFSGDLKSARVSLPGQLSTPSSPTGTAKCSSWQPVSSAHAGPDPILWGVFGTASDDVWAVGAYYSPLGHAQLQHWDGDRWRLVPDDTTDLPVSGLRAGTALSSEDAWAVGFYSLTGDGRGLLQPLLEHWDGRSWSMIPSPQVGANAMVTGITAIASDDVWAVGSYSEGTRDIRALVEHWDGKKWAVVPSPDIGSNHALVAMVAVAPWDVWAVGWQMRQMERAPLVEHWDGRGWAVVSAPASENDSSVLNAITGVAGNDVWAVGNSIVKTGGLIEHWDGSTWTIIRNDLGATVLSGIAAFGANDIWAVGTAAAQKPLIAHWDGRRWSAVDSTATGKNLRAVAALVPKDAWAVGDMTDDALILRYRNGCLSQ
jgi:Holliday junction resolvase